MRQSPNQHVPRWGQSACFGAAVEDHGRAVTGNVQAATFYRRAQQAVNTADAVTALRLAVRADPAFALAIVDLDAITEAFPSPINGHQMNWERHHIEVVTTAVAGNLGRAADLLREHLASVGCDPLAQRIVTGLRRRRGYRNGPDDLGNHLPSCHAAAAETSPGQP